VTDRRQAAFVQQLRESPVAINTVDANRQHYDVPARLFELTLGPHLKYSSCYWAKGDESLPEAELAMLELTVSRARLADGQRILELGCGWVRCLSSWPRSTRPRASQVFPTPPLSASSF
jgi:cyclopropane-fatty-acyl-phospholipid synthase